MFRPKNTSNTPSASDSRAGRQKLESWTNAPSTADVKSMHEMAQQSRGSLIEVQIRRDRPPVFVLTCQWDPGSEVPVWSLYEGEDGSKSLWCYPNGNLDMMHEIICMSLPGAVQQGTAIPASLSPEPQAAPPPQPQQGIPAPVNPAQYQQPGYYQQYPPNTSPGQYPPPQGYSQYPNSAPQPAPGGYPPQNTSPWIQQAPQPYPQNPPPAPALGPTTVSPEAQQIQPADMSNFIDLLQKGKTTLLLGHLFVEAGVMPEPCLEAALKLQELARKGLISNSAAVEALRRAAERGGVLDDDVIAACRAKYPESLTSSIPALKPTAAFDPKEFNRSVVQLILQTGVITQNDLTTADNVRRKHGGDVCNILTAAGKLEKTAYEAAKRCLPLIREHRLNQEEACRLIKHCQKTKASVDEAFQALSIRVL